MTQTIQHIGFIGGGNMAQALLKGLINTSYPVEYLHVADRNPASLTSFVEQYPIHVSKDNLEIAKAADILILAIKPQNAEEVLNQLAGNLNPTHQCVVSIVTGITLARIQELLQTKIAAIRCMPNTPAMIGQGASVLFANAEASPDQCATIEKIFRSVGYTTWIESETLLNAITALSGSGPAYFFYFMQAMLTAGLNLGIPEKIAHDLTLQTALGAAQMALQTGKTLAELQRQVMAPGGTTERAILAFDAHGLDHALAEGIQAAFARAKELTE